MRPNFVERVRPAVAGSEKGRAGQALRGGAIIAGPGCQIKMRHGEGERAQ